MRVKAIAVFLLTSFMLASVHAQDVKIRKSIDSLSDAELETYAHALAILKSRPASEMESYSSFERLHNGGSLPNGEQGGCIHGEGNFLPWHRILLAQFEDALQKTDPPRTANVMLPYWDFSKDPTGTRFPAAFENQQSILWHSNRFNLLPNSPPDWVAYAEQQEEDRRMFMDKTFLKNTLFDLDRYRTSGGVPGFSNNLESSPHNVMHTPFTLGDMGSDITAARDPIFWSYHCYIDLMWYQWQVQHQAFHGADPILLPADLNQSYQNFAVPMTVGEVIDPKDLGYIYQLVSDQPPPIEMTNAESLKAVEGKPLTFQWKKKARPESIEAAAADDKAGAIVRMESLKHGGHGSWKIEFFLHPKDVEPDFNNSDFRKRYFAAQHAVWHGNHRPVHHDAESDLILRLTGDRVQDSLESNQEYTLSVHYRALPASVEEAFAPKPESLGAAPLSYKSLTVNFD